MPGRLDPLGGADGAAPGEIPPFRALNLATAGVVGYSSAPMKKVKLTDLSPVERRLVQKAIAVREKAYAPFSHYKCGAALLDVRNRIHAGCNIETIDFTLTTHAEMDAINDMIKTGVFQLKALACAVQSSSGYALPCGLCRQKIREFSTGPDARIIAINLTKQGRIRHISVTTIGDIYPNPFTPAGLA